MSKKMHDTYSIGVDVGGTKIQAGLVDSKGSIIDSFSMPTQAEKGDKVVIRNIKLCIENVMTKDVAKKVSFIGIGFPSPVNKGVINTATNLPGWKRINLKRIIEKRFRKKTIVENDANCFALAELFYGVGKDKKINGFVGVTLGTGIGTGMIIDRKLYRGSTGSAGEYTHVPIGDKRFDYYAKGYLNELKKKYHFNMQTKEVAELAKKGKAEERKRARQLFNEYGKGLGKALSTIIKTIDPEVTVISGSISNSFGLFEKEMKKEAKRWLFPETAKRLKIVKSKLDRPGILGAACLKDI